MSNDVYILGVGRTPFTRVGDLSLKSLTQQAVNACLQDAELSVQDVEAVYFANAGQGALGGQHMIRGQVALRPLGFEGLPVVNVENACASATTALRLAMTAVQAGEAEIVLAVGAERLAVGDSAASKAFFQGALDVSGEDEGLAGLLGAAAEGQGERSVFMDVYAGLAREHMRRFGTTQQHLAAVAAKNRRHASLNPDAQLRDPLTMEEVLAARSVVWPLTLPMCAPIGNGAAAAVVCSAGALKRLSARRAVRIAAAVVGTGSRQDIAGREPPITRRLANLAYERAGLGPRDVDLAEVHDATAAGEILQTEYLGLIPEGQGGISALAGETSLGGRIPVNLSGGLECNGHPIGATGLAQVHEIVTQLRGEAGPRQAPTARIGLVENGGGFIGGEEAVASVVVLEAGAAR